MGNITDLMNEVLKAGVLEIRDIDRGEKPFAYSSGNKGPGYVMIKGLVGQKKIIKPLLWRLTQGVAEVFPDVNFVAGNATGGMIPGYILSEYLEYILQRPAPVPYVYVRNTRKIGGHGEYIVGHQKNPLIKTGDKALVVEELANFTETTCNSAVVLREAGYQANYAACILFYNHPESVRKLAANQMQMIYLFTLDELLFEAEKEGYFSKRLVDGYRAFLKNPAEWQKERGLK